VSVPPNDNDDDKMNARLRPMNEQDIQKKVEWMNDPLVNKFIVLPEKITREGTKKWFLEKKNDETVKLFIIEAEDGNAIGYMKLDIYKENMSGELHILIGEKNYWGKGYAQEGIKLFLDRCFTTFALRNVFLYVFVANTKAVHLFKKMGFTKEKYLKHDVFYRGMYHDRLRMSISKEDYMRQFHKSYK
jgi:RimJ/RimL family protein N-acetyltransferase